MKRILLIEDDAAIARYLELELKHEGFELIIENDGEGGLAKALSEKFDVILLDVMLPKISGIEVLRRLRKSKETTPVILLTAKGEVSDKVTGLDSGANDYMTKPFYIEELLARIRVIFREKTTNNSLHWEELTMNPDTYQVIVKGQELGLTKKEYELLYYLLVNRNIALSRENIIENVWGYEYYGDTNIVDVFIKNIRRKLEDVMDVRMIQTIRGIGYVIKDN
ncbi:response regulator transcription factor [Shouchella clausii]|uniref:DNA-binding response regulator n=1 Tax=Shouchella clausii TaxID=79880 RepID=A0A268S5A9_SHOCL|nr:response regulator transcription factor [Shouchella clausii]PAD43492.1 DNA-binding response regulator [Bacillus sp. 7520-S]SPU19106.1 two-component response regulator [Niallia circulans]AST95274.1 DNA-binding response regulator [Shouchella clausii]MBU8595505.1 response regulator transcription factor [Shouchella clausii]MCM3548897.1 response regulator transcription factor [Shouchella clausii]